MIKTNVTPNDLLAMKRESFRVNRVFWWHQPKCISDHLCTDLDWDQNSATNEPVCIVIVCLLYVYTICACLYVCILSTVFFLFLNALMLCLQQSIVFGHIHILFFQMHKNTYTSTAERGSMWEMSFQWDPHFSVFRVKKKAKWAVLLQGNI